MTKTYTQDALWKLFENLPLDLKEAVFSEDTAKYTWQICERHAINDVSKVAKQIGLMLMGLLTIQNFENWLQKELKIKKDTATTITQEVNKFILLPVRPALESITQDTIELDQSKRIKKQSPPISNVQQKIPRLASEDPYKESTETDEEEIL